MAMWSRSPTLMNRRRIIGARLGASSKTQKVEIGSFAKSFEFTKNYRAVSA